MQIFWVDEKTKAQGQPRFTKVKKKKNFYFCKYLKIKRKLTFHTSTNGLCLILGILRTDQIFIAIQCLYVKLNNDSLSAAGQMQNLFIVPHLMPSPHNLASLAWSYNIH